MFHHSSSDPNKMTRWLILRETELCSRLARREDEWIRLWEWTGKGESQGLLDKPLVADLRLLGWYKHSGTALTQNTVNPCIKAAFIETQMGSTQEARHPQTESGHSPHPASSLLDSSLCTGRGGLSNYGVFEMCKGFLNSKTCSKLPRQGL